MLFYFQEIPTDGTWLKVIIIIAGAVGFWELLKTIYQGIQGKRKLTAESQKIESQTQIDERTADADLRTKTIKMISEATEKILPLTTELMLCREKNGELVADNYMWQRKEILWEKEKEQLNNTLKTAGELLNEKDHTISELREQLNGRK